MHYPELCWKYIPKILPCNSKDNHPSSPGNNVDILQSDTTKEWFFIHQFLQPRLMERYMKLSVAQQRLCSTCLPIWQLHIVRMHRFPQQRTCSSVWEALLHCEQCARVGCLSLCVHRNGIRRLLANLSPDAHFTVKRSDTLSLQFPVLWLALLCISNLQGMLPWPRYLQHPWEGLTGFAWNKIYQKQSNLMLRSVFSCVISGYLPWIWVGQGVGLVSPPLWMGLNTPNTNINNRTKRNKNIKHICTSKCSPARDSMCTPTLNMISNKWIFCKLF